jgi:hypothetical protein
MTMIEVLRWIFAGVALLILSACGGGSTNGTPTSTVNALTSVLKKTGQTKSYDANGTVVLDNSVKDDGYYQAGVSPVYTRDDVNNIVTDHITGLQWQDDANVSVVQKPWVTTANYNLGDYNNTLGDTAATYCRNLTLGGFRDWRLPTIDELMYIADRSKANPAIDGIYFKYVVSGYYWSSSTVVGFANNAWDVLFYNGNDNWHLKSYSNYVRCVRGQTVIGF